MGVSKIGGVGLSNTSVGENGPSTNKFEASNSVNVSLSNSHHPTTRLESHFSSTSTNRRLFILDYIHKEISLIKSQGLRTLTKSESLQLNLCTRMHNLFQDDVSDPLELILAVVNDEPYLTLPSLPHGKQPLLDAHRYQRLSTHQLQLFKVNTAIELLLEVGLGFYLLTRLDDMARTLTSEIKSIKATYSSGELNGRN